MATVLDLASLCLKFIFLVEVVKVLSNRDITTHNKLVFELDFNSDRFTHEQRVCANSSKIRGHSVKIILL